MRWPRTGIVVGVMGLVLLGAGWWLTGVGAAGPVSPVTRAPAGPVSPVTRGAAVRFRAIPPPPFPLLRQLQQSLFRSSHPQRPSILREVRPGPRFAPGVHGSTCFVAGGFCSIKPCVVPVATATAAGCRPAATPWRTVAVSRLAAPTSAATFRPPSP
jgi:hypothetical protein